MSPAGWLTRTGISSGTLRSVIEYGLPLTFTFYYIVISDTKAKRLLPFIYVMWWTKVFIGYLAWTVTKILMKFQCDFRWLLILFYGFRSRQAGINSRVWLHESKALTWPRMPTVWSLGLFSLRLNRLLSNIRDKFERYSLPSTWSRITPKHATIRDFSSMFIFYSPVITMGLLALLLTWHRWNSWRIFFPSVMRQPVADSIDVVRSATWYSQSIDRGVYPYLPMAQLSHGQFGGIFFQLKISYRKIDDLQPFCCYNFEGFFDSSS